MKKETIDQKIIRNFKIKTGWNNTRIGKELGYTRQAPFMWSNGTTPKIPKPAKILILRILKELK